MKLDGKRVEGSAYSRYYVISAENLSFKTVQNAFAKELHRRGLLPSTDLKTATPDEVGDLAKCVNLSCNECNFEILTNRVRLAAANSLAKPTRAKREFGWEPKYPLITETIKEDVDALISALNLAPSN